MLFDIPFVADWKQVGEYRVMGESVIGHGIGGIDIPDKMV